jgi:maltooligosyltrehalose trehalohydrolase
MRKDGQGYWSVDVPGVGHGQDYMLRMGNRDFPDPASHWQPLGVHGPSRVADHKAFAWGDAEFSPPGLEEMVLYELHAGAFTPQGTLDSAVSRLDHLVGLGVNAVEVMPVAQFPGSRNWGYDGVFPFAVQDSYGGPEALKRFVDACHARSLAVILDVVYNHLGPEGNALVKFGPYLHGGKDTPWGGGFRYDGPDSAGVRGYVLHNALHWLERYHIDGLRLDAASCIHDASQEHVLAEMGRRVKAATACTRPGASTSTTACTRP